MTMNLTDKTVVITGANGGLGKTVADTARGYGAKLILLDITFTPEQLQQNNADISRYNVDLGSAAATRECFDKIGRFDAVFNLAGGFTMGPTVYETTDEEWDFLFKMNVSTMHNVVRAAVPKLLAQKRGAIVNVGALGALKGAGHMGAYCASKSVVMRLTESLSEEVKHQGINVNAVLPSLIDTPRNRADMPDADFSKWLAPADLANVICFLASDAARAVHGALIPVAALM
jgi:NAD(P)-dependent dehydrogenase (short-subunit alcohol dehydrogenase family)